MPVKSALSQPTPSTVPALWKHQQATVAFEKATPFGFDLSDPGTGKTRSALTAYVESERTRGRLLVLCPKTLMASAWGADIDTYEMPLTYTLAYAEQREEAFKLRSDVVIMNIDGVKWLAKEGRTFLREFDYLIIDEVTAFKHPSSQRSKALASMRRAFSRRYGLTGTPNPISVTELWHQALIIDGGRRLGDNYYRFRNIMQFAEQIGPMPQHRKWIDKPGAEQATFELLQDITIRHAFEDVMTHVPPNHKDRKEFLLTPKTMAAYKKLEDQAYIQLEQRDVVGVHAAALRSKLLQLASGAVYASESGDDSSDYVLVDRKRYELIADLVEERQHSVVFFNWRHQRDELIREFKARDITYALIDGSTPVRERDEIVRRYQNGEYQTILLHPRTGAHGLTLTRGTTTILASPIYEADLLKQAIHRVYRGDQRQVTNTIMVIAAGTVEKLVYERLDQRTERMDDFLELIKLRRS